MTEIGFEAFARKMAQGDEGFLLRVAVLEQITLHLGVTTAVVVLLAQATKNLSRGMPLLGRSEFVVPEDLVDERVKLTQRDGRSLESELRQVLTEAALAKKRAIAAEMRVGLEELRSKYGTMSDSAKVIRDDRDRRG